MADGETYGTVAGETSGIVSAGETVGFVASGQTVGMVDSGETVGTIPRKYVPPVLTITNFEFENIGTTGVKIDYDTSVSAKCKVFIRTDAGPGPWVEYDIANSWEAAFHSNHSHATGPPFLSGGTWHNIYLHVYDIGANTAFWPFNDSVNHGWQRFKTATRTEPGEEGDIMEG